MGNTALKKLSAAFSSTAAERLAKGETDVEKAEADLAHQMDRMEALTQKADAALEDAEAHAEIGSTLYAASFEKRRLEGLVARARTALVPLQAAAAQEAAAEAVKRSETSATLALTRADSFVRAYRELQLALDALSLASESAHRDWTVAKELTAAVGESLPDQLHDSPSSHAAVRAAILSTELGIRPPDRLYGHLMAGARSKDQLLAFITEVYQVSMHQHLQRWPAHEQLDVLINLGVSAWRKRRDELSADESARLEELRRQTAQDERERRAAVEKELTSRHGFKHHNGWADEP
jgi:hypothetical protein